MAMAYSTIYDKAVWADLENGLKDKWQSRLCAKCSVEMGIKMKDINFFEHKMDLHKFDNVTSDLLWGKHPEQPFFTIMVPTYKRTRLLLQALKSAINQRGFDNYEILVLDNDAEHRNTKTEALIEKINCDKIVYYKNRKNIGIYGSTVRSIQLSRGRYVALLDDDDLLHPDFLRVMYRYIIDNDFVGMIGVNAVHFRGENINFPSVRNRKIYAYEISGGDYFFGTCIASPGSAFAKSIASRIYPDFENADKMLMGDQVFQYKSIQYYSLVLIDFPLAGYRLGEGCATREDEVLLGQQRALYSFRKQIACREPVPRIFHSLFGNRYIDLKAREDIAYWGSQLTLEDILSDDDVDKIRKRRKKREWVSVDVRSPREKLIDRLFAYEHQVGQKVLRNARTICRCFYYMKHQFIKKRIRV